MPAHISLGSFALGCREPFLKLEHGIKIPIDPAIMKVVAKIELDEFEAGEDVQAHINNSLGTPARWQIEITNFILEVSYPRKFYVQVSRERLIGRGTDCLNDYGEMIAFRDSVITEEAAISQVEEEPGAWVAAELEPLWQAETKDEPDAASIIVLMGTPSWKFPRLTFQGHVVREFKKGAPDQTRILDEFEKARWAGEVEIADMPTNTLDDALAALRRKCQGLCFRRVRGRASWSTESVSTEVQLSTVDGEHREHGKYCQVLESSG